MPTICYPGKTGKTLKIFYKFLRTLATEDIQPPKFGGDNMDFMAGIRSFASACERMLPNIKVYTAETLCPLATESYNRGLQSKKQVWQIVLECNPNTVRDSVKFELIHPCNFYILRFVLTTNAGFNSNARIEFEYDKTTSLVKSLSKRLADFVTKNRDL